MGDVPVADPILADQAMAGSLTKGPYILRCGLIGRMKFQHFAGFKLAQRLARAQNR